MADYTIEGTTLKAHDCTWDILGAVKFEHRGIDRVELEVKKPKGKKRYTMVLYENGTISRPR